MFIHIIDNICFARNKAIYESKDVHAIEAIISARRSQTKYHNNITNPIKDNSYAQDKS